MKEIIDATKKDLRQEFMSKSPNPRPHKQARTNEEELRELSNDLFEANLTCRPDSPFNDDSSTGSSTQ